MHRRQGPIRPPWSGPDGSTLDRRQTMPAGHAYRGQSGALARKPGVSVFSQPIRYVMDKHKLLTVAPETTVYLASQKMAKHNAGAVLVVRDEGLIGIFTERDVVFRVVARGLEPKATPVA